MVTADVDLSLPATADDAETACIGIVLHYPEMFAAGRAEVAPDQFRSPRAACVWAHMDAIHATGALPDVPILKARLAEHGLLDNGVPLEWLKDALLSDWKSANITHYARLVAQASLGREVEAVTRRAAEQARGSANPRVVLDELRASLDAVERDAGGQAESIANLIEASYDEITSPKASRHVKTGYVGIDGQIIGFAPANLILLGGRPGMGKTALLLNILLRMAKASIPVGFFSLEMSTAEVLVRLMSTESGVSLKKLIEGGRFLSDEEKASLKVAATVLKALPIWIDDTAGLGVNVFRSKAQRLVSKGVKCIGLDHLGLMSPPKSKAITNRENEVGAISRALKRAAKDLDVPVVALMQLNRETAKANEGATDASRVVKPGLTSLRDSGSLEQDADMVLFIHRDAYYTKDPFDGTANVLVAKNRQGECGSVSLGWDGRVQRFFDTNIGHEPGG